ncbi:ABC transporter substrate-binding protein [Nocardia sp. alder85J]|uniref:ABC transporter substrate-binding protein n=1 Tax=Nocardia sp. alder85J TaxID=2862949 RepID=UPI001CD5E2C8|nr:ABC transporter substrate-binding protein [Nocardia sp. alder85J]MCX4097993.1 ABC transporter substrate-binding protein [Nocardia sp. alder85J]
MIGKVNPHIFDRPVSRRGLLVRGAQGLSAIAVAGGVGSALAACSSSSSSGTTAGGLTKAAVQFCYLQNVQFAGSYFATTKGYYKAAGLEVTLLPGGPSLAPEPIVLSGKANVAIGHTAEVVSAINNGAKLTIIGACFQKNPTCILSLAGNPITKPTDMYGKKIGVSDTNAPIWKSFVKANSLDESKITVVTVGFDVTSVATKEIDGIVAFAANEPTILKLKGLDPVTMLLGDFNYPLLEDLYMAKSADLEDPAKMKTLVGLMKAESLGWADVVADPDAAATLTVDTFGKTLGLDPAQQKLDAGIQNTFVADADTKAHGLFWMTDEKIAGTIKSLALGGVTATPAMFSTKVLEQVYQGRNVPA